MPATPGPFLFGDFLGRVRGQPLADLMASTAAECAAAEAMLTGRWAIKARQQGALEYVAEMKAFLNFLRQIADMKRGALERLKVPPTARQFYKYRRVIQPLVDDCQVPIDALGPFGMTVS